jgi:hypothetical protein
MQLGPPGVILGKWTSFFIQRRLTSLPSQANIVEVTMLVPTLSGPSPFFLPTTEWAHTSVLQKHCTLLRITRHFVASVLGLMVLVGGSTSSLATPFTLNFNGTVSSVDPLLATFFSVGDSMKSSFTYESSVGPHVCQAVFCAFDAITAFSYTVGDFGAVGSSGRIELQTFGILQRDEIDFLGVGTVTPTLPGWRSDREFVVSLTDSTGTRLNNLTLPNSVNVADYDSNRWFVGFSRISDGQFAFVNGTVPIPNMLWPTLILMVGMFLFVEHGAPPTHRKTRTNKREH